MASRKDSAHKGSPTQKAILEFKDYIKSCTDVTRTSMMEDFRKYELYPSSFPYCGLRHGLDAFENKKLKDNRDIDFFGAYYTSVGVTVHEVIQDWFGRGGKIIGNWKCSKCEHLDELLEYGPCTKCGCTEVSHEEIKIKFKGIIRGRIDGLFVDKYGNIFLIDYKTSGSYPLYLHNSGKESKFPYMTNKVQISAYCYFVMRMYNKKLIDLGYKGLVGWMLIYISRDKSFKEHAIVGSDFTQEDYDREDFIQRRSVKHFKLVTTSADNDFNELPRILVDEKPCSCKSDYEANMKDWYNECPYVDKCFSPKKLEAFIKKIEK